MFKILPDISKEISSKDIFNILEKNYSEIVPVWIPMQTQWMNNLYKTFKDSDKFMIIIHLLLKTFNFYSKNFVKLNYKEYFDQSEIEIKEINIMEISNSLNIPKETTRRKVNELESVGVIKRIKKKIIIDREAWPSIKPEDTMKRMSHFLSILSKILYKEKIITVSLTSDQIIKATKENFSYVWKLYFEMQVPMLLEFKKIYGDIETFHVHGICLSNQALNSKKIDNSKMTRKFYLEKYFINDRNYFSGINTKSISDITGIPRATVIRKLKNLIKEDFLRIDNKKHYSVTGTHIKALAIVQKKTFKNLSLFAEHVYNLCLIKKNN
jgi:DNA-binding Lrp family transcriptional regulator